VGRRTARARRMTIPAHRAAAVADARSPALAAAPAQRRARRQLWAATRYTNLALMAPQVVVRAAKRQRHRLVHLSQPQENPARGVSPIICPAMPSTPSAATSPVPRSPATRRRLGHYGGGLFHVDIIRAARSDPRRPSRSR
jgi:hypothetical protein